MTEYHGKDEETLRSLLDACGSFEERRKIRAALRLLKERNHGTSSSFSSGFNPAQSGQLHGLSQERAGSIGSYSLSRSYRTDAEAGDPTSISRLYRHESDRIVHRPSVSLYSSTIRSSPSTSVDSSRTRSSGSTSVDSLRIRSLPTTSIDTSNLRSSGTTSIDSSTLRSSGSTSFDSSRIKNSPIYSSSSEFFSTHQQNQSRPQTNGSIFKMNVTLKPQISSFSSDNPEREQSTRETFLREKYLENNYGQAAQEARDITFLKEKYLGHRTQIIGNGHASHSSPEHGRRMVMNSVHSGYNDRTSLKENHSDSSTLLQNHGERTDSPSQSARYKDIAESKVYGARMMFPSTASDTRVGSQSWRTSDRSGPGIIRSSSAITSSAEAHRTSESHFQPLSNVSSDVVERRKLEAQSFWFSDSANNKDYPSDVCDGDVRMAEEPPSRVRVSATKGKTSALVDYDKIETMEEFKTLLAVTDDFEEKRKIRNSMRHLRKRLELEKVKLSSAGKGRKSESRRQSEDITVQRPSSLGHIDIKRRSSEDVLTSFKNRNVPENSKDLTGKSTQLTETNSQSSSTSRIGTSSKDHSTSHVTRSPKSVGTAAGNIQTETKSASARRVVSAKSSFTAGGKPHKEAVLRLHTHVQTDNTSQTGPLRPRDSVKSSVRGPVRASESVTLVSCGTGSVRPTNSVRSVSSVTGSVQPTDSVNSVFSITGSLQPTDSLRLVSSVTEPLRTTDSLRSVSSITGSVRPTDTVRSVTSGTGLSRTADSVRSFSSGTGSTRTTDTVKSVSSFTGSVRPSSTVSKSVSSSHEKATEKATEDFLSDIKARLSSREESLVSGKKVFSSVSKTVDISGKSTRPSTNQPKDTDTSFSANKDLSKDNKSKKFLNLGTGDVKQDQQDKRESSFRSSLSVSLQSGSARNSNLKDKSISLSSGTSSAKQDVPDVSRSKIASDRINSRSVFERLSQGKDSSRVVPRKEEPKTKVENSTLSSKSSITRPQPSSNQTKPERIDLPNTSQSFAEQGHQKSALQTEIKERPSEKTDQGHQRSTIQTEIKEPSSEKTLEKRVFTVDLKAGSRGLSRSHSDVLPQTRSLYRSRREREYVPLKDLQFQSDMEKAFLDMLDDMDHKSTASSTKLSDVEMSDEEPELQEKNRIAKTTVPLKSDSMSGTGTVSSKGVTKSVTEGMSGSAKGVLENAKGTVPSQEGLENIKELGLIVTKTDPTVLTSNEDPVLAVQKADPVPGEDVNTMQMSPVPNQQISQSRSWIVLRNVKEDLNAMKFIDENDNSSETVSEYRGGNKAMDIKSVTDSAVDSDGMEEKIHDEENNNVVEKESENSELLGEHLTEDDVASILEQSGEEVNTVSVPPDTTLTYKEDDDGTVTVQQISQSDQQDQVVTVRSKMYRTLSNAQAEERDTVVETRFTSPGGTQLREKDVIRTKKKITSRGSNYYQRSVHVTRKVKGQAGDEIVEQDLCVESDNKSVSQGQSWGDRVITKVTLDQPAVTPPMIEEAGDVPKKSHATLVLNKLNVSKASSGYGSVSGSEEDDKEEMVNLQKARPKGCPEVTLALKDAVVKEGEATVLECSAAADPVPTVSWYLGHELIDEDDHHFEIDLDPDTGRSCLTIKSATLQQAGDFRCVFTNEHGEAETKSTVTVKRKPAHSPEVISSLHDVTVTEGHSVTLTCHVTHAEFVSWYKDGFVQRNSSDFKQSYDGDVAKLEIGEVFLDDYGEYACVARNELGEARTACRITVTACDSQTAVVPMFLTKLSNMLLTVGDKLALEVDVIGSPEPSVTWTKDGRPIRDDCGSNEMYDGRTARLEIDGVETQDSGKYQCVADNEAGHVSMDANVTVQVKNRAPVVNVPLNDCNVSAGEDIKLSCEVSGFPQPSILWKKNGMMVGNTPDFRQTYDGRTVTLEIMGSCTQDTGTYQCIAKNGLGDTSSSCQLTVTDTSKVPEEKPQSSQVVQASHTPATSTKTKDETVSPLVSSPEASAHPQSIIDRALKSAFHRSSSETHQPTVSTPLPPHPQRTILTRSESERVTSSLHLQTSDAASKSSEPSSADNSASRHVPLTRSFSKPLARTSPFNTISKFLAMAAAKETEEASPIMTTLDSPAKDRSSPVTPEEKTHPSSSSASPSASPSPPLSKVQQLKMQLIEGNQSQKKQSGAPIRRWHSMPPQDLKPVRIQEIKTSSVDTGEPRTGEATMPSYDDINDEEELMKIMSKTDDFDERRKIRARLKEVREKDKADREARRQQREKEAGDVVKQKAVKAEEDKKRRMQQFTDMAAKPGTETKTETKTGTDGSKITTTTTTTTAKTDGGGTRTQTVKKTETTISKTSGMGGVQYAKPGAEETLRKLSNNLQTATPPGTSGRISVKTESWNSRDGNVNKTEKTESWGAKPGGARGAMAAFKQMDATNTPAQPNALVTVSLAKKAATTMRRNAIAIKQDVLVFCTRNTEEYQNIQITNFSSCWNNGLAFCALIHHFFPHAFDYNSLSPKNRRFNFDLAFDTAEKEADIAPLLDTEDMVRMKNPDWKCVFTYVQSIYRHLRDHDANKAKEQ